jgi:hypothetical protein
VDPTNAVVFRICGARLHHDCFFGFDIFGDSYATFSAGVFGHSGKDSLLTKVETRRQQLIMYVSVGTTLVQKGVGVTILPMTGSRSLLYCSPHLGTTEHLA